MNYIKKFIDITAHDLAIVGGKNTNLGIMIQQLHSQGVAVPDGFAITAQAYWHYIDSNNLRAAIQALLEPLNDDTNDKILSEVGAKIRQSIAGGTMPEDLKALIIKAYVQLGQQYGQSNVAVAVRSSATAEDLPTASFAGQQETFLNIKGAPKLLTAVKDCFASLFTDRAISYRMQKGFDHAKIALSVGVQKMVRADVSGVAFTLDTETGFQDVVFINAAYGLGELVVQGIVNPDEFYVHKPTLAQGWQPILKKRVGTKEKKMVYAPGPNGLKIVPVTRQMQGQFALTDQEILDLARLCVSIEQYYSQVNGHWTPQDIEWARDSRDGKLYILQTRPETVHSQSNRAILTRYYVLNQQEAQKELIMTGLSIGQKIVSGRARVINDVSQIDLLKAGEILVAKMTDPDWVPLMKRAAGIITDRGGRTCHAAIVSRELGIPAIVGTLDATTRIQNGQVVTLDCSSGKTGYIYHGVHEFETRTVALDTLRQQKTPIMLNLADPDTAFINSFLPVQGVGLARLEFIIAHTVQIHPMALLNAHTIPDKRILAAIKRITAAYPDCKTYFIDTLAQEVGTIAAAFWPKPVIVRLSDFKSNEYRNLLGGSFFEPIEQNPMLGLRGASRYYSDLYGPAFALECAALHKVRQVMGLQNVKIMLPFVRTLDEAQKVVGLLADNGLIQGQEGLELIMMCEIPANVLRIDQFSRYFDGFSIGSNDLTQFTLAVDRDSGQLANLFDERDPAVKKMMELAIAGAHAHNKPIGICGQAPSDYFEIAEFLIKHNIDYLSLNPDAVMPFLLRHDKL